MKQIRISILILFVFSITTTFGQRIDPHSYDFKANFIDETGSNLSNDTTIDVSFYNIDVNIALDSAYISGNVTVGLTSLIDGLSEFKLDLDSAFTVDSISSPAESFNFQDNILTVNLLQTYNIGDYLIVKIHYKGVPTLAGGYKGLRYENHDGDQLVIASLSTPYLAHYWWPCKDGTQDKSDSTFVDITIKDTIINAIPVIAISNGLLDTVEVIGNNRKFRWKHYYPIVPYYVMVAISNYKQFSQTFEGDGYSFPIDYYVFDSHWDVAHTGVELMPSIIEFFTEIYGPYPFLNEKYGMTQLGYYGAIENQTNTIINNMSIDWLHISTHELSHMWFADMITCDTWHHGWINEGFATYSEALFVERFYNAYHNYVKNFEYYDEGTIYMEDVSNPYTVFRAIIYNKGAYVLHMLRHVVGDELFFDIIYEYANDESFKYSLATTEDFQLVCEDISGENLDYFFEQWIYDERYPMYYYNFEYNESNGDLGIVINQNQGIAGWREVFTMPLDIGIEFADGTDTIVNVTNDQKFSYYSFSFEKEVENVIIDPNDWVLKNVVFDPEIIVNTKESELPHYSIYPNPSSGSFIVQFDESQHENEYTIDILNISGQYISGYDLEVSSTSVKIEGLDSGIYFLRISMNGKQQINKLVVMD